MELHVAEITIILLDVVKQHVRFILSFMTKQILFLTIFFAFTLNTRAQDTVRIWHANYITVFDKVLKYPVLVEWWDTREKVSCSDPLPRKDQFKPDPQLPEHTNLANDYLKSGYDRGHMCPAADNKCLGDQVLKECFYFSNMAPQLHSLNAGDWEKVERLTRDLSLEFDSVHVWAGSVGIKERIKSVSVPEKCWKVIYVLKTKAWHCFIMPNQKEDQLGVAAHEVSKRELEKLTGFKFN